MKKIFLMIMMLCVVPSARAAVVPSIDELMTAMEQADAQTNDLSYSYKMKTWKKGTNRSEAKVLLEGKEWYKKPHQFRSETTHMYMADHPKYTTLVKVVGNDKMVTYDIRPNGTARQTASAPIEEWATSGYPPQRWRFRIQKHLEEGYTPDVFYQPGTDVYLVKFFTDDLAMYKIQNHTWRLVSETLYDKDQDSFVENVDTDIQINAGLSDDLFRVPGEAQAVAPAVSREIRPRTKANTR